MKYNIALIPVSNEVSHALIALAQRLCLTNFLKPTYLLKDPLKDSIPHISVFQFEIEDNPLSKALKNHKRILQTIGEITCEVWRETLRNIMLECMLPSKITYKYDNFASLTWAEITIIKSENPLLQLFHDKLRTRLVPFGIKCINVSGECYSPHFTLFNVSSPLQDKLTNKIPKDLSPILNAFYVTPILGLANSHWELIKILASAHHVCWKRSYS